MSSELSGRFPQLQLLTGNHEKPFATSFARDVLHGLSSDPKRTPSMHLYDDLGSTLFEAICKLPEYNCTRGESALLNRHRWEIANLSGAADFIVELGGGSGEKAALLVPALLAKFERISFHNVDISRAALEQSRANLTKLGAVQVMSHQSSFLEGLRAALSLREQNQSCLVMFLGSTISNFEPPEADKFFVELRALLRPGDALLLGTDLIKPRKTLLDAYDDRLGVTAAFNKNLLVRINRELHADFNLDNFVHQAIWDSNANRIEMHLCSLADQNVTVAGQVFHFETYETIWTENSYKYSPEQISRWAEIGGFQCVQQWVDRDSLFACNYLVAV